MPQPAVQIPSYLSTPLPQLRENYPPGTGGTGPRSEWPEGTLKHVEVIDGLEQQVEKYLDTLPQDSINPHPAHKYPKFVQAITTIPQIIKSPADLQKSLSTLPLLAVSSMLTTLWVNEQGLAVGPKGAQALDKAGYESDGGEEAEVRGQVEQDERVKGWYFQFSKSPMGSGEFLLMQQGSPKVYMVVRTINSSAFSSHDWDEYIVTGDYRYNTKSKASWYWSRSWGATKRLDCNYYVLTDWQRWVFGVFNDDKSVGYVSPIWSSSKEDPSIMQALFYWARSATGDKNGFQLPSSGSKSNGEAIFPDNPARRVSVSGNKPRPPKDQRKVKAANESDIEESDAEDAS